jgi:hypothetical protein
MAGGLSSLWTWLPVEVLATRQVSAWSEGSPLREPADEPADFVIEARMLLAALDHPPGRPLGRGNEAAGPSVSGVPGATVVEIAGTDRRDAQWRGSLPAGDFQALDEIPAEVLISLASAGERTFREASSAGIGRSGSGARALSESVLDHVALTVSGGGQTAEVPQRAVQALSALGFLGPGLVTVSMTAVWLRLSATYGAVQLRRGPDLGLMVT